MQINVYIANLAKYNEGKLVGRWVALPLEREELEFCISKVLGRDEEYAIHDYEAPFEIGEYDDVFAVNEAVKIMSRYDDALVEALCEYLDNRNEVICVLEGGDYSVFYGVDDLADVAEQMVEEGFYGPVPPSLASYIDYEKIGHDLHCDGWHMNRRLRVAVRLNS
ncbi:antirestriction protein ArdA [Paenibacillus sp. JMULE4]|uniref:antirestriction protein ArdA n=1 Tax=Paenibacillus sp. JMULE4 TaxID=2518342 RepID=UPI001575C4E9|nr:antirestriction protein ArdA [Paenibacillus sp. JMULE4]NTZ20474.1 antirestriction protein ArdA [Paenibacillus sp. JMULE4]